jgi:hypothetical protein
MQDEIRGMDEHDFPAVEKFRELHASGRMNRPLEIAHAIWRLLGSDVEPDDVVDIRQWL